MNRSKHLAIFAISALLVGVFGTQNVFADESLENEEDTTKEKMEKDEIRKEKMEKENEIKKEQKEKIEQLKKETKELRDEYKEKLEEKKKILKDYEKELKEKYNDLKNEFKEKYEQLRISSSDMKKVNEDNIEYDIKRKELRLLKHEFRDSIKNLKLDAKQHFDELKNQLKAEQNDRKNKLHDRIIELKEKYKNKILEHKQRDLSELEDDMDYTDKKINVCHTPSDKLENSHSINISVNALRAHLAHGDYIGMCEADEEPGENDTDEEENDEGNTIHVELKEELGIAQQ